MNISRLYRLYSIKEHLCAKLGKPVVKLVGSLVLAYFKRILYEHISRVKSLSHYHRGNACDLFSVKYAPLDRPCTSVSGEKRSVDIYAVCLWNIEYPFGQDLTVCHDHDKVGSKFFQKLICIIGVLALFHTHRLIHGDIL